MQTKVQGPVTVDGMVTSDGFEGFEEEDIAFGATEMYSTAAMLTTSSYPRLSFPDAVDSAALVGMFNFPDWYTEGGSGETDLHIGWSNESAAAGDVLFAWNVRQVNPGSVISAGTLLSSGFLVVTAPANGVVALTVLDSSLTVTPGGLGYTLGVEVGRLGTNGLDTLAGPIGFGAIGFKHIH